MLSARVHRSVISGLYAGLFITSYARNGSIFDVLAGLSSTHFLRCLDVAASWSLLSLLVDFVSSGIFHFELKMISFNEIGSEEVTTSIPLYACLIVLDMDTFINSWWLLNLCWFYDSVLARVTAAIPSNGAYHRLPSRAEHTKFFLLNVVVTGLHVHLFCHGFSAYLKRGVIHDLLLCCIAFHQFSTGITELLCHLWFVQDRANFGSSIQTHRRSKFTRGLFKIIGALSFAVYAAWCLVLDPGFVGSMRFSFAWIMVYRNVRALIEFLGLENQIKNELANATQEDVDRAEVCLICRVPMTVEGAKLLKCGHCYHADCLERWFSVQRACPLCTRTMD
jgi:hypothetical protein